MRVRSLSALLFAIALSGCKTPISDEMTSIGFTPNPAPTDNLIIGTVYDASRNPSGQVVSLVQLCNPSLIDNRLVRENVNYVSHNTTETQKVTSTSTKNNLTIDSAKLQQINASLRTDGKTVRQIFITIKDAKILDTDKTNLDSIALAMATKNPGCKQNITSAKSAEGIMRVFVANVIYSVDTESGQDFGADVGFQNVLKASLGAQWDKTSHTFSSGNQLTYGYILYPVSVRAPGA